MNPLPLDWRQLDAGQRRRFKQELSVIVRGEELSNVNGIWGIQAIPRTMRLLPLWKEIFAELGINARNLHPDDPRSGRGGDRVDREAG